MKVGGQTSVSCYTATKCHYGLVGENVHTSISQGRGSIWRDTTVAERLKCFRKDHQDSYSSNSNNLYLQLPRKESHHLSSKNPVLTIWHSHRYASGTVPQFKPCKVYSINEIVNASSEPDSGLVYFDKQCHPAVQVYRLENTKPMRKNENHSEICIWGQADDWKRLLEHSQSFWKFCSWLVRSTYFTSKWLVWGL